MSFSPTRVRVILVKELTDYRRNRFVVVFAMIVFPLIFIAALTAQLLTAPAAATSSRLDARIGLSLLYMLLIPATVPSTLAAHQVQVAVGPYQLLDPACVRRVGVVDDPVSEREGAQPRRLLPGIVGVAKLYSAPRCCCSSVKAAPKPYLKSLPSDDTQGNRQPIRCLYPSAAYTGAAHPAARSTRPQASRRGR